MWTNTQSSAYKLYFLINLFVKSSREIVASFITGIKDNVNIDCL